MENAYQTISGFGGSGNPLGINIPATLPPSSMWTDLNAFGNGGSFATPTGVFPGNAAPQAAFNNQGGFLGQIGGFKGLGQIAQGLASLGSVYTALKSLGLAKDQFRFTKQAYETNLANQTQSYNTSLEDRIRARYATEGRPSGDVQSYLDKHSL